jgi:hypothetical protein
MYKDIVSSILHDKRFSVTESDCFNTVKLLNTFYLSDEESNWVSISNERLSSRLGRADDKISNLYRTPALNE